MATQRKIEIFSAGCPICTEAINQVRGIACPSCNIVVMDMNDDNVAKRAKMLGIRSVPAIVIDGAFADCCSGRGLDEAVLSAAGLGQPLP